jgi:hypothetical protein
MLLKQYSISREAIKIRCFQARVAYSRKAVATPLISGNK